MRIRGVDDLAGHEGPGYEVQVLRKTDHRLYRYEACARALAIMEKEVDDLRQQVALLLAKSVVAKPESNAPEERPTAPLDATAFRMT